MRVAHLTSLDSGGAGRACLRLHKALQKTKSTFLSKNIFKVPYKISSIKSAKKYLKKILKYIRDSITRLFVAPFPPAQKPNILLIRTDAIGDYLLFRPFLSSIRQAYPDYHITLLGNECFKELAMSFDSDNIDSFLWLSPRKFSKNLLYRILFLHRLKSMRFTLALHPVFSRDTIAHTLIAYVDSPQKIAPIGDMINTTPQAKQKADRFYTRLTPCQNHTMFEYYRNEEFFAQVLPDFTPPDPHISHTLLPSYESCANLFGADSAILPARSYSVLFIGASASYRKWSVESFAKVGAHLIKKYKENILICGGKEDKEAGDKLANLIKSELDSSDDSSNARIINLAGATRLTQLASLVYNGNHLVSNETSCAHVGALLYTTIFVVYNGNHLGRFIPYPQGISDKYYPVYHPFIAANMDQYEQLSNAFAYKSELNINEISPQMVIDAIDKSHKKELA